MNRLLVKYLHIQAVRGSVPCQYMLGKHYYQLEPEYWSKAYAWLSVAAEQGHEKAVSTAAVLEAKLKAELLNAGRELTDEYKKEINKRFWLKT